MKAFVRTSITTQQIELGVIIEKGSQVTNFHIGDKVIFTTILQKHGGSWAEYAVAKQNVLIRLPNNLVLS